MIYISNIKSSKSLTRGHGMDFTGFDFTFKLQFVVNPVDVISSPYIKYNFRLMAYY